MSEELRLPDYPNDGKKIANATRIESPLTDAEARVRAIDSTRSFLVQAPAGSGKTELLTQRMLRLLATVERPEAVLAITFTRKAAREMRNRILEALEEAGRPLPDDAPPLPAHKQELRELAVRALVHDEKLGWHLLDAPERLQVRTFDSFCESVARQLPMLAGFGQDVTLTEDAEPLYREAAMRTIALLGERGTPYSVAIFELLYSLDNNLPKLRDLLVEMLKKRAQWMSHLGQSSALDAGELLALRERLQQSLASSICSELRAARESIALALGDDLPRLLQCARTIASEADSGHEFLLLENMNELPEAEVEALPQWRALRNLCLTKGGGLRKLFTAKDGFNSKISIKDCKDLFDEIRGSDSGKQLCSALIFVTKTLPSPVYTESEWRSLTALLTALPLAAAQLRVVEGERGMVDFSEVAMAATAALKTPEGPTDLGLALGCRIRHLLVDEFQDTSRPQVELLMAIAAVWEVGEGCTVFAVGDPMQSIYAFREAEVRNFIEASRDKEVANQPVETLRLTKNFRSTPALVDWFNQTFPPILGPAEITATDLLLDRVGYTPASQDELPEGDAPPSVTIRGFAAQEYASEAESIASIVENLLWQDEAVLPEKRSRIAILVRSRAHLLPIVAALQEAKIRFRAIDIDALGGRQTVLDLESIARALLNPADRASWLALLRAPWCGLSLADLWALCRADGGRTILQLLEEHLPSLSTDGQRRAAPVLDTMSKALRLFGVQPLGLLVERTWVSLGGPFALPDASRESAWREAEAYFTMLGECASQNVLPGSQRYEECLGKLFAPPDPDPSIRVELLTIHKAKGLEWEHVILPALGRKPRQDDKQLLYWRMTGGEENELLLAPLRSPVEHRDVEQTLEGYLREQNKRRKDEELKRLFYVAATRAKKSLTLTATLPKEKKSGEPGTPNAQSILALLWDGIGGEFQRSLVAGQAVLESQQTESREQASVPGEQNLAPLELAASTDAGSLSAPLRRIAASWQPPAPPEPLRLKGLMATGEAPDEELEEGEESEPETFTAHTFEWATLARRGTGTAVHAFLQQIAREGLASWSAERVASLAKPLRSTLIAAGVPAAGLEFAAAEVQEALTKTLADERGRWILDAHAGAASEFPVTVATAEGVRNLRMDRTFIDERGTRWIVDFKLTHREGGEAEEFLTAQAEKYREDLLRYREAMRRLEKAQSPEGEERAVRCALYFPLQSAWREIVE